MIFLKRSLAILGFLALMFAITAVFHVVYIGPVVVQPVIKALKKSQTAENRRQDEEMARSIPRGFDVDKELKAWKKQRAEADESRINLTANIESYPWDLSCFAILCVLGAIIVYVRGRPATSPEHVVAPPLCQPEGETPSATAQPEGTTQSATVDMPPVCAVHCPQCGTRVVPKADGKCPACQKPIPYHGVASRP